MRIFITGHDGFIGSHMVPDLATRHELGFLEYDLRDHAQVKAQLHEFNPDVIVHLAARTEVEDSFYEQIVFSEVNYVGTVNLIESAATLPNLQNFVFASTMEVYGWQPISDVIKRGAEVPEDIFAFDEDTRPNPNAPYAVAKYACEKYLEYAHRSYGLPFTSIRQTNCYGRKDNDFFVTEQIISQMLKNPQQISLGYAEPYRNFIYIEDLLSAWRTIIENPDKAAGEIFCLGPDNAIKIREYAKLIAFHLGWNGNIVWDQKPQRPGEIYLLNSSHSKLTKMLGWEPQWSLDAGIQKTVEYWSQQIKQ